MGESVTVKLQPEEAYGDYDTELVQIEELSRFPKETKIGMQFEGAPEGSDEDDIVIYRVTDVAARCVMSARRRQKSLKTNAWVKMTTPAKRRRSSFTN